MQQKYDVIVVGAGIAGITAAIYLKRYGYDVLVIERNYPGGQLNKIGTIENYPGLKEVKGPDFAFSIYEQAKALKIPFLFTNVEKISIESPKKIETTNDSFFTDFIILATGRNPRKLGLEMEEELIGKGISYCATCDGAFFKDKVVGVVGGGNSAIGEAIYLASLAKKVYVIHRKHEFRASRHLIEKVNQLSNVEIYYDSIVTSLKQENEKLSAIVIKQNDTEKEITMDGIFVYIGMEPNCIEINVPSFYTEDGYISVDKNMETSIDGIYACGDAILKEVYQLTTSVGEGTLAATSIHAKKLEQEKSV